MGGDTSSVPQRFAAVFPARPQGQTEGPTWQLVQARNCPRRTAVNIIPHAQTPRPRSTRLAPPPQPWTQHKTRSRQRPLGEKYSNTKSIDLDKRAVHGISLPCGGKDRIGQGGARQGGTSGFADTADLGRHSQAAHHNAAGSGIQPHACHVVVILLCHAVAIGQLEQFPSRGPSQRITPPCSCASKVHRVPARGPHRRNQRLCSMRMRPEVLVTSTPRHGHAKASVKDQPRRPRSAQDRCLHSDHLAHGFQQTLREASWPAQAQSFLQRGSDAGAWHIQSMKLSCEPVGQTTHRPPAS